MGDINTLDLFHSGNCYKAYEFFGCHRSKSGGYVFRVWAPHALKVSLVGTFNDWQDDVNLMAKLDDGECFECVVSNANEGDLYKFCIQTFEGRKLLKADPFAFGSDFPNSTSSVICSLPAQVKCLPRDTNEGPVNIYEVNLLSWRKHEDNSYYTYSELVNELVPYVKDMGYTHVEFMPITEYPFDGSWGYQVTGYFSVVNRLGSIRQFAQLIQAFHDNGIKVILDWVPAHFPKDDYGLYEFDGQPLYESALWDNMEHRGWGTRKFDFSKPEVNSFLLSSACYLLSQFGIDGLRVDAVASMLYLDYDKKYGDWTPNIYGDNRNLHAIEFIKAFNLAVKDNFPDVVTIAEESTSFSGVTLPVRKGGLGFDYKWNMGWMNDVLFYCRQDPLYRHYHHNKITFSMVYSLNERYILPLSHDEVVHVKGSIVNKMPGCYEDKFAGERLLLGFMYAHPGKKLNFMGYEVAQFKEWDYKSGIEFFLTKYDKHCKMQEYIKQLNLFYRSCPQLFEIENSWDGFEWLVVDDVINNVLAFNRFDNQGNQLLCVFNFSGIDQKNYTFGQHKGKYQLVFNSDDLKFGGEGHLRKRIFTTKKKPSHGKDYSLTLDIPKLACLYIIKQKNI